jgi:hypothetical protein
VLALACSCPDLINTAGHKATSTTACALPHTSTAHNTQNRDPRTPCTPRHTIVYHLATETHISDCEGCRVRDQGHGTQSPPCKAHTHPPTSHLHTLPPTRLLTRPPARTPHKRTCLCVAGMPLWPRLCRTPEAWASSRRSLSLSHQVGAHAPLHPNPPRLDRASSSSRSSSRRCGYCCARQLKHSTRVMITKARIRTQLIAGRCSSRRHTNPTKFESALTHTLTQARTHHTHTAPSARVHPRLRISHTHAHTTAHSHSRTHARTIASAVVTPTQLPRRHT